MCVPIFPFFDFCTALSVYSLRITSKTYDKSFMEIIHEMVCILLSECVSDVKFSVKVKQYQGKYLTSSMRLLLIGAPIHTFQRLNAMNMIV